MRKIALFLLVFACLGTEGAFAQGTEAQTTPPPSASTDVPDWVKKLKFSGKFYLNYQDGFRDELDRAARLWADDEGAFRVTRAYFGATYQATPQTFITVTLDAAPRRLQEGPYAVVLKKAFVSHEYRKGHSVQFGQLDLPWVVYVEDTQGDRFARLTFTETEGYLSSADLGVTFKGASLGNRLRYHVGVVNGNNWTAPETDRTKDMHALLTVAPFAGSKGWRKGFFVSVGSVRKHYGSGVYPQDGESEYGYRLNGLVGYQDAGTTVTFEVLGTKDPYSRIAQVHRSANRGNVFGSGFSYFFHTKVRGICPRAPEKLGFLARADYLDPTRSAVRNDSHSRVFVGPTWVFNKNFQAWAGYAGARHDTHARARRASQNSVGFFLEAKF